MDSREKGEEFEPARKRSLVSKLRSSRKREDSLPSLLIPTKLNSKRTTTSRNSTTESSQTRSMMESRATVYPASVLDDHEYYQVPVMIPETVFENPEQKMTEDIRACGERGNDALRSRFGPTQGVEDVEGMSWDIWAGPSDNGPHIPKPPPAVYPGDEYLQDTPNLRFLTMHDVV